MLPPSRQHSVPLQTKRERCTCSMLLVLSSTLLPSHQTKRLRQLHPKDRLLQTPCAPSSVIKDFLASEDSLTNPFFSERALTAKMQESYSHFSLSIKLPHPDSSGKAGSWHHTRDAFFFLELPACQASF